MAANICRMTAIPHRCPSAYQAPRPSMKSGSQVPAQTSGYAACLPVTRHHPRLNVRAAEEGAVGATRKQGTILAAAAGTSAESGGAWGDGVLRELARGTGELARAELLQLMEAAAALRDAGPNGHLVSFSPKVFIPVTRLCRDSCGYCTFAQPPATDGSRRAYMTIDEAVAVARAGAAAGCQEALLTLGDKPELLYPQAAEELTQLGHSSTLSYVQEVAAAVATATGLLPHVNAGVMSRQDIADLRRVSASQGLMLESASARLMEEGLPHHNCPDKDPAVRLATIEAAGQAAVPFTSGLLIGIGETREERLDALLALRQLHRQYGHIQEIIIQNFRAKPGTTMADHPEPPEEELLWTVSVARIVFGPTMNIQAPPNLAPGGSASWRALLDAGINDWGGVSPVTRDWVNPEKPWPMLPELAAATAAAGKALVPRLTLYPAFAQQPHEWLDGEGGALSMAGMVRAAVDGDGWARLSGGWFAGATTDDPPTGEPTSDSRERTSAPKAGGTSPSLGIAPAAGGRVQAAKWVVEVGSDGVLNGCPSAGEGGSSWSTLGTGLELLLHRIEHEGYAPSEDELAALFTARGAAFDLVCAAADRLRAAEVGDSVSYVVNRNINYTNICTFGCTFCAFSKGPAAEELRGQPYLVSLEEVTRRTAEAWDRGATEVCMQGGIHPSFTGDTYLSLLEAAKVGAPGIHVHAFSPLEVHQGASSLGMPVQTFLQRLKSAGLGSLPGTAAEVLDDDVRKVLCPDKLNSEEWCDIVVAAHEIGLPTTSTIMFGHCDSYRSWARHLCRLRDLQAQTGGLSEFVPLAFVHMEAPLFRRGLARRGPTLREAILMHAVARLARLGIDNIQASWVKMGPQHAASLLAAGANDMGGVLMNESITRAAGAQHGQELSAAAIETLVRAAGRTPWQRTTLYQPAPPGQAQRALETSGRLLEPLQTMPAFPAAAGSVL